MARAISNVRVKIEKQDPELLAKSDSFYPGASSSNYYHCIKSDSVQIVLLMSSILSTTFTTLDSEGIIEELVREGVIDAKCFSYRINQAVVDIQHSMKRMSLVHLRTGMYLEGSAIDAVELVMNFSMVL